MSKIILGVPGAYEQPLEYGYRQGQGPFTRRTWKCTDIDPARALISQLLAAKYSYTVTEGPVPMVVAEVSNTNAVEPGTPEVPTNVWEKSVVAVQKDILETDYAKSVLNDADFVILNKYKKSGEPLSSADLATLGGGGGYGTQWYNAIKAGVTSTLVYQTILRHTQIVSSGYPLQWTTNNDGRILTTAQLTSLEGLPSDLKFAIPASSFGATYLTGWLKIPATVQTSSPDKWIVTQEFQFGEWLNLIYDAAA
jgi:hypothetical protein